MNDKNGLQDRLDEEFASSIQGVLIHARSHFSGKGRVTSGRGTTIFPPFWPDRTWCSQCSGVMFSVKENYGLIHHLDVAWTGQRTWGNKMFRSPERTLS